MWKSGDSISKEDYYRVMFELEEARRFYYDMKVAMAGRYDKPILPPFPLPPCSRFSDGSYCINELIAQELNIYKVLKPATPKKRWWSWIKLF